MVLWILFFLTKRRIWVNCFSEEVLMVVFIRMLF